MTNTGLRIVAGEAHDDADANVDCVCSRRVAAVMQSKDCVVVFAVVGVVAAAADGEVDYDCVALVAADESIDDVDGELSHSRAVDWPG